MRMNVLPRPRKCAATLFALSCSCVASMPALAVTVTPFAVQTNAHVEYSVDTAVARSTTGAFVVGWYEDDGVGTPDQAHLRVYNADGSVKAEAILPPLNDSSTGNNLALAMDPMGNFVVVWEGDATPAGATTPIRSTLAQRFDVNAVPQGDVIIVGPAPAASNGPTYFPGSDPAQVAMDDQGDFAVAWSTSSQWLLFARPLFHIVASSAKTYAAVYKGDGSTLAAARVIDSVPYRVFFPNGYAENTEQLAKLVMNSAGDMVVVLNIQPLGTTPAQGGEVGVRRFHLPLKEQGLRTLLTGMSYAADAAIDAQGNFAITTLTANTAPSSSASTLTLRRYGPDATPIGSPVTLENIDPNFEVGSNLAMSPSGDFAIVWNSPASNTGTDTVFQNHGQFFHADGTASSAAFLIDAVTDQLNWKGQACAIDAAGSLVVTWNTNTSDFSNPAVLGSLVNP